jgi:hypothetical protein
VLELQLKVRFFDWITPQQFLLVLLEKSSDTVNLLARFAVVGDSLTKTLGATIDHILFNNCLLDFQSPLFKFVCNFALHFATHMRF